MKIATKTLATMMIVVMLSFSTATASAMTGDASDTKQRGGERKLEKIYRHHDRKMELRASVLGMSTEELRAQLRSKSFDTVIKQHGFKDRSTFHTAVVGKLKDELRRRGWSDQKIEKFVQKRLDRLSKFLPKKTQA